VTQTLRPGEATLAELETIWRGQGPVQLDPMARSAVEASAKTVARAASGDMPVYGINTGFGDGAQTAVVGTWCVWRALGHLRIN